MAFEIVIVGGGLSGLALAVELAHNDFSNLRVLILEQRQSYVRDRTWSYWTTPQSRPHRYRHLERKCWSQWRVQQGARIQQQGSATVTNVGDVASYCTLDGDAFYSAALHAISHSTHVQIRMGVSVQKILGGDTPIVVTSEGELIPASWVFDARPPVQGQDKCLVQQFLGYEVRAGHDVFDPTTVELMHFQASAAGLHFFYVLPYTRRNALVESTWISLASHKPDFEAELRRFIATLTGSAAYEVVYQEKGLLSLGPGPRTTASQVASHVAPLGRGAGTLRASTGYAFLETLAHTQQLAASLRQHMAKGDLPDWLPPVFTRPALDEWMDTVFLGVLARDWNEGAGYFMQLFERVDADTLVAFLSGAANWRQRICVARALPALPFAAQALSSLSF